MYVNKTCSLRQSGASVSHSQHPDLSYILWIRMVHGQAPLSSLQHLMQHRSNDRIRNTIVGGGRLSPSPLRDRSEQEIDHQPSFLLAGPSDSLCIRANAGTCLFALRLHRWWMYIYSVNRFSPFDMATCKAADKSFSSSSSSTDCKQRAGPRDCPEYRCPSWRSWRIR